MDTDQASDPITQFVSITGSSIDQARFFVESAGGNLDVLDSFHLAYTLQGTEPEKGPIAGNLN